MQLRLLQPHAGRVAADPNLVFHGFLRFPGGSYSIIDAPNAGKAAGLGTLAWSINLEGARPQACTLTRTAWSTGFFSDANGVFHGFVRDPGGSITTFDPPTSLGTFAASISLFGEITGYFFDANNEFHGFLRSRDGAFTVFDVPGASSAPGEGSAPFSVNLFGTVTGEFFDSNSVMHGFARFAGGRYVKFDAPGGWHGRGSGHACIDQ